jgi:hypothetical protein
VDNLHISLFVPDGAVYVFSTERWTKYFDDRHGAVFGCALRRTQCLFG